MKLSSTALILIACAAVWAIVTFRLANREPEYAPREIVAAPAAVQEYARQQLNDLQRSSFANQREYCGVIVEDEAGTLSTLEIFEGDIASCSYRNDGRVGVQPVATFHTHGGASVQYDDEAPSFQDFQSDLATRLDGYIATPGGRFWRIDWQSQTANLVCGEGCLTQDPNYQPCPAYEPEQQYDIKRLQRRFRNVPDRC